MPGRVFTESERKRLDAFPSEIAELGEEQGVSVYTFRDERDLLWHSLVFSAADRESAYVIDGLMHNDVVKSDIHSTEKYQLTAFSNSDSLMGWEIRAILRIPMVQPMPMTPAYTTRSSGRP